MAFDLKKAASEKIIVVAHRGVFGGNIPCNTIASYETALAQIKRTGLSYLAQNKNTREEFKRKFIP